VLVELVGELFALEKPLIWAVEWVRRRRVRQQVVCDVCRRRAALPVLILVLERRVVRGRMKRVLREEAYGRRVQDLVLPSAEVESDLADAPMTLPPQGNGGRRGRRRG
jgi:hypothetical protein